MIERVHYMLMEAPDPLPVPGSDTSGLTWDGERLWGADLDTGTIQKFEDVDRGWQTVNGYRGRPGPLA